MAEPGKRRFTAASTRVKRLPDGMVVSGRCRTGIRERVRLAVASDLRARRRTVVTVDREQCVGFGIDRLLADFGALERCQRGLCERLRAERQGRCL
ncbi:hypothetical protein DPR02_10540 [Burkholderia cepacia]|uniref:Uncharacterized protein n=1 Tax=Burkholderia cepacia TaxID=292 RepID=A0AAQ0FE68_BURCE|nr:hypothetical protein DPR02_10540 [Burkholderia cepacia]